MGSNHHVTIKRILIYDASNQLVEEISDEGIDSFGNELTPGIYFLTIVTEVRNVTKKIVKLF